MTLHLPKAKVSPTVGDDRSWTVSDRDSLFKFETCFSKMVIEKIINRNWIFSRWSHQVQIFHSRSFTISFCSIILTLWWSNSSWNHVQGWMLVRSSRNCITDLIQMWNLWSDKNDKLNRLTTHASPTMFFKWDFRFRANFRFRAECSRKWSLNVRWCWCNVNILKLCWINNFTTAKFTIICERYKCIILWNGPVGVMLTMQLNLLKNSGHQALI